MKPKVLFFSLLLIALCLSAPYGVRAGGPAPTTTGSTLRGKVRFRRQSTRAKADQYGI